LDKPAENALQKRFHTNGSPLRNRHTGNLGSIEFSNFGDTMGPNTTVLATKAYSRRADLPSFFIDEKDVNILRAHLIYREGYVLKTDNDEDDVPNNNTPKLSHFVAVPLSILPQYEANECIDESTYLWELSKMTTDQLQKLLAKLGRPGQSNKRKNDMLNSLYMIISEEEASSKLQQLNEELNQIVSPQSKVVFRVISALFGEDLRVQFGRINDTKKRAAFESGESYKNFFKKVSTIVSDDSALEHSELLPCENYFYKTQYDDIINYDVIGKDQFPGGLLTEHQSLWTTEHKCEVIYKSLLKVRSKIMDLMTRSGNGDNNAFNFAECAISLCEKEKTATIPKNLITPHAAYYFYMQCAFFPVISSGLTTRLPKDVKSTSYQHSADVMTTLYKRSAKTIIDLNDNDDDNYSTAKTASKKTPNEQTFMMRNICKSMDTMASSYESRTVSKEQQGHVVSLKNSLMQLRRLEKQYISDLRSCMDIEDKPLIRNSLIRVQARIIKEEDNIDEVEQRFKIGTSNENISKKKKRIGNYTPATHECSNDDSTYDIDVGTDNCLTTDPIGKVFITKELQVNGDRVNGMNTVDKNAMTKKLFSHTNVVANNGNGNNELSCNESIDLLSVNSNDGKKNNCTTSDEKYDESPYVESMDLLSYNQFS
jgi:hypothetical protein